MPNISPYVYIYIIAALRKHHVNCVTYQKSHFAFYESHKTFSLALVCPEADLASSRAATASYSNSFFVKICKVDAGSRSPCNQPGIRLQPGCIFKLLHNSSYSSSHSFHLTFRLEPVSTTTDYIPSLCFPKRVGKNTACAFPLPPKLPGRVCLSLFFLRNALPLLAFSSSAPPPHRNISKGH